MNKIYITLAAMAALASAHCQAQDTQNSSTTVNPDGTVTFRYTNKQAKSVQVEAQFADKTEMTREGDVWTATLGPAAPDIYPYSFTVDGVSVMDPLCDQYFPNEGFKNSLLEIKAPNGGELAHDIKNVPHGSMDYVHYYSKSLGATNIALVYTPPTYYDKGNENKRYPVFYLVSGTTDTEEVYYKVGRVNYILDNLLAAGDAKEMIVVLPYGNPTKLKSGPANPMQMMMGDVFGSDLVSDLMPYVESHYRTIADRDHRAIGGFSRGGNQGLMNGLRHLDKFSYLCSYSSFTSTDIPGVYDNADDTNSKIHLFWLGVGTDDFLYGTSRDYMEHLDTKGIRSVKEFTHDKFGHTWMNAKYFLDRSLRLLFNPEASEAAMREGKPALAKTGKEEPFTASVMARLFPRPIVSPEYGNESVTFRMKAENAGAVTLKTELDDKPVAMTKDGDGVWSVTLTDAAHTNSMYKYSFVVDGTEVADPSNMYLSPDKGFKSSVAFAPSSEYHYPNMALESYGTVTYHYGDDTALYTPAQEVKDPVVIRLVPGKDDTVESWFKVGAASAIADKLMAEGSAKPCYLAVGDVKTPAGAKVITIRADKFRTWPERMAQLEKTLRETK